MVVKVHGEIKENKAQRGTEHSPCQRGVAAFSMLGIKVEKHPQWL